MQRIYWLPVDAREGRGLAHKEIIGSRGAVGGLFAWLACSSAAQALDLRHAGLIEFDWMRTSLRSDGQRELTTDAALATLELGLTAQLTPAWHSDLLLLAEDIGAADHNEYIPAAGATDKRPDRLHIEEFTFGYSNAFFSAAAGRMTVPFGRFETQFLSDPQTLETGETQTEAGARAAYQYGNWRLGAGLFDGNLRSTAPDTAGYSLSLGWEGDRHYFGLGYLSDQYAADPAPSMLDLAFGWHGERLVAGVELTGAARTRAGERPRALHAELGWEALPDWQLGLRYQATSRFSVLDGGNGRFREWAVGTNRAFNEHIGVGMEYAIGREGGVRQHAALARLTVTF